MARRMNDKPCDPTSAVDEIVRLALIFTFTRNPKLMLQILAAITAYGVAASGVLAKWVHNAVLEAPETVDDNGSQIVVPFTLRRISDDRQTDCVHSKLVEETRSFIDSVNLTTNCVAAGAVAAKKIEEGSIKASRMVLTMAPQAEIAKLDENFNVVVQKSPHRYIPRLRKLLVAQGVLSALGVDLSVGLDGETVTLPALPPGALKVNRHFDSIQEEVCPITGFLKQSQIAEFMRGKKATQLAVPNEYVGLVEQAAKQDSSVRMKLEMHKCNNPCLPDAPLLRIESVEQIVKQENLQLVA